MQPSVQLLLALALAAPCAAQARTLPVLDHEPRLGILIARESSLSIAIEAPVTLVAEGGRLELAPGTLEVEAVPGGWRITGGARVVRGPGRLVSGGRAVFRVEATPEFGPTRELRLAGDLELHPVEGGGPRVLELVERLPMEEYLASVVASEMSPRWPRAALAAQAIVARSYAAARWMERFDQRWHVHWHFGVDMAYHGRRSDHDEVLAAIRSTRGEVLMYAGFPVLALFHASSGGRTEAFERIKPGVRAPDGVTPIAGAMPVVTDPAALPGSAGLDLSGSHGHWKADLPLPEVEAALLSWSEAKTGRPRLGKLEAVSVLERHEDSGRVATVSLRHRIGGEERFTSLQATDFRMAVSPVSIRSLLWDRCVIAARAPGYLVLEGRGFGHGCGLSQVSAWHLAQAGESPEAIVARFYAGARIERRY